MGQHLANRHAYGRSRFRLTVAAADSLFRFVGVPMKALLVVGTLAGVLCISAPSAQQSRKPARAASPAPVPKGSSLEMQKVIEALSGRWSIFENDLPRQGAPTVTGSGTEVWYTATGGATLIEENSTKSADGEAHDTALIWWDGKAQKILGVWCADINDTGCSGFGVHREGSDVVMTGEWESQGKNLAWREVFTFTDPNSFSQSLSVGPPGRDLERVSVIRATRLSNSAANRSQGWEDLAQNMASPAPNRQRTRGLALPGALTSFARLTADAPLLGTGRGCV